MAALELQWARVLRQPEDRPHRAAGSFRCYLENGELYSVLGERAYLHPQFEEVSIFTAQFELV